MKIDNYIKHIRLQIKGLNEKYLNLQSSETTYYEKTELKLRIKNLKKELKFLVGLRKAGMNNEMQDQKNKQR